MNLPPLSEIRAASWDYLRTNAAAWTEQARTWEAAFTEVRDASMHPGGTEWTGPAAEAFQHRADTDLVAVRGPVDMLDNAAAIATRGADAQEANQRRLLNAVDEVQSEGYRVAEDYTATDTRTDYSGPDEYFARNQAAEEHTNYLRSLAQGLVTHEDTIARQLTTATAGLHEFGFPGEGEDGGAGGDGQPQVVLVDGVLHRGRSRNLGLVAGTGANPGVPGIGAADLGEVVTLPNGKQVMILGDSFSGDKVGVGDHYPSAAVPVHFENGRMVIDGPPLTGPDGSNVLFPLPQAAIDAGANNTLPAGSIKVGNDTYMMVVGTNPNKAGLAPMGGSWLVKVTDDPAAGWEPVEGSYRPWQSIPNPNPAPGAPPSISDPTKPPTQISGYQGNDGRVYIAADGFDRQQGVSMYSVDPQDIGNRAAWQPWTGNGWGNPGEVAQVNLSGGRYGELSFQEVDGQPVISGFNGATGSVDLHVGDDPTGVFAGPPTVVAPGGDWNHPVPGTYPQNYGGYILPGSTLDDMGILVSQWNTDTDTPYVVEQFQVNANR